MPTQTEVRDLAADLFGWRATQGPLATGARITKIRPAGPSELEVAFDDGTAAFIAIRIYHPQPDGGQP